MQVPDPLGGFGMGLVLGIVIGVAWGRAFDIIKMAIKDRRRKMTQYEYISEGARKWLWRLGILLAVSSVMMIVTGAATLYFNSRLSSFVKCQAGYNQQTAIARDARIGVTDKEMDLLFVALKDNILAAERIAKLPKDQQEAASDKIQDRLIKEFHRAIQAHDARIANTKAHPYPPNPDDTCGEY